MYDCFHFTVAELRSHNTDFVNNKGYLQGKSVKLVQSFVSYWVQSLGYKEAHTSVLSLSWMILSLISVPKLLLMALSDFLLSLPGDMVHFSQAWTWHMEISRFVSVNTVVETRNTADSTQMHVLALNWHLNQNLSPWNEHSGKRLSV